MISNNGRQAAHIELTHMQIINLYRHLNGIIAMVDVLDHEGGIVAGGESQDSMRTFQSAIFQAKKFVESLPDVKVLL